MSHLNLLLTFQRQTMPLTKFLPDSEKYGHTASYRTRKQSIPFKPDQLAIILVFFTMDCRGLALQDSEGVSTGFVLV